MEHRIEEWEEDGRFCWDCDCGHGGSALSSYRADVAIDRHLASGDTLVNVYHSKDRL